MGEGILKATGRTRDEWFAVLDEWGAPGRPYREIAGWLTGEHGMSRWWAQKLVVEYEQARSIRHPGARPDGTFEVSASKAVGVPVETVFEAVTDGRLRERWLPDAALVERTVRRPRSARYEWSGGAGRVAFTVTSLAEGRSQLVVQHQRITDPDRTAELRRFWQGRLAALKSMLEEA